MNIRAAREKDAARLAAIINTNPTPEQIEAARHALRLFYRFAAAYQASFYTEQSRTATQAAKEAADAKSERAYKRAADALKPYRVRVSLPGLYPIIDHENGSNFSIGHFYH